MNTILIEKDVLANKLKQLMSEKKTQKAIAESTGISQSTINRFYGQNLPFKSHVTTLALYFDVNIQWLVHDIGKKTIKWEDPLYASDSILNDTKPNLGSTNGLKLVSKHEDIIKQFKILCLAKYLNELLLDIENLDYDYLNREIKTYLEATRSVLESEKKQKPFLRVVK